MDFGPSKATRLPDTTRSTWIRRQTEMWSKRHATSGRATLKQRLVAQIQNQAQGHDRGEDRNESRASKDKAHWRSCSQLLCSIVANLEQPQKSQTNSQHGWNWVPLKNWPRSKTQVCLQQKMWHTRHILPRNSLNNTLNDGHNRGGWTSSAPNVYL